VTCSQEKTSKVAVLRANPNRTQAAQTARAPQAATNRVKKIAKPWFEPGRFFPRSAGGKTVRFTLTKEEGLNGSDRPILAPETQSAFHPHAQRNAFRRRGVHRQSRSFARAIDADTQPQLHPALLRLSAMISQCFTRDRWILFKKLLQLL
jgi:hypothetical protein